jgi:hypothetical protein
MNMFKSLCGCCYVRGRRLDGGIYGQGVAVHLPHDPGGVRGQVSKCTSPTHTACTTHTHAQIAPRTQFMRQLRSESPTIHIGFMCCECLRRLTFVFLRTLLQPSTMSSGWYTPDYSQASRYRKGGNWGYKQGCAFATQKCIGSNFAPTGSPAHFCTTTTGASTCTLDR